MPEPFRFHTAAVLARLTNHRLRTLSDLRECLRIATGPMLFQHTYNSLLERTFLPGAPQNDFAFWVTDALRQRVLGERLGAVDVFDAPDLGALRQALFEVVDSYFQEGGEEATAAPGQEFHLLESVSLASPTGFVAHDLPSFRDALSRVAIRSIYYHFLTARLRLGRKTNDFSVWLAESLGEKGLAADLEQIDPAVSSLEDLRRQLVRAVDRTIATRRLNRRIRVGLLGSTVVGGLAAGLHLALRGKGKNNARDLE